MGVAHPGTEARGKPRLAVTYNGRNPGLLDRLVPLVDAIEFAPDAIATTSERKRPHVRPEVIAELNSLTPDVDLLAHGVGLSIGSFDRWEDGYVNLLDEVLNRVSLPWHSEHLAYTTVAGENLGTMLPLPRTEEALDLVCGRVQILQERYAIPFLLENVIGLLPDAPAGFTPAGFLNEIVARTDCHLLLDVYNLECDRRNFGLDVPAFLDELNLAAVVELHLAGGVEHDGFQLDVHSQLTDLPTLLLAQDIVQRTPNLRMVTYEYLDDVVPLLGHDAICAELARLREVVLS